MKTAISLDAALLLDADKTARLLRLSRSAFFAQAVDEFLKRHRQAIMLTQLNEVYAGETPAARSPSSAAITAKVRNTVRERW